MRLRPTGNKGPVAVSLKSFADYHASESWTWEHMALTRARLVAGPDALRARVEAEIRRRLTRVARGVAPSSPMRATCALRMAETFPGSNVWDLKHAPGGLVDIEFIAQALQLVHGPIAAGCAGHQHHRGAGEIAGRGFSVRTPMPMC